MKRDVTFPVYEDPMEFEKRTKDIYSRLMDDKSRDVYENRLLFSLTGNYKFIRNISVGCEAGKRLIETLVVISKSKDLYIYGAGIRGRRICQIFSEIRWAGFLDAQKAGDIDGYTATSPEQIIQKDNSAVLISVHDNPEVILNHLCRLGYGKDNIYILNDYDDLSECDIYFDEDLNLKRVIDLSGSFIDIGCFDGKDSIRYLDWMKGRGTVHAFEADETNYSVCRTNLENYNTVSLHQVALSNNEGYKLFDHSGAVNSKFSDLGDEKIETRSLDSLLEKERINYIKMDVEGAEEEILDGAREIIRSQHPILAVSIYHKRSDIWRLPEKILSINENYRFYLRHYSTGVTDTVLYALCGEN